MFHTAEIHMGTFNSHFIPHMEVHSLQDRKLPSAHACAMGV